MADLSKEIIPYVQGKRYAHTLSVAAESVKLADMFGLCARDRDRIETAAYLHDLTKGEKGEGQIALCAEYGLTLAEYERAVTKTLHARTGAEMAKRLFPSLTDDFVYDCIRLHTTGAYGMTLPQSLLYLADYIEPTRSFDDCVKLRRHFYDGIKDIGLYPALNASLIESFGLTITGLIGDGEAIADDTVAARNYFILHPLSDGANKQ